MGAGRQPVLDSAVENTIAQCLIARAKLNMPCDKEELLTLIQEYITNNDIQNPFNNNRPGNDWYMNFMKRHPELSLKKAELLQKCRVTARDPFVVYNFYDILKDLYEKYNIEEKSAFIFNCDESGFPSDPTKLRGIGEKGVPLSRATGGSGRENTSVLACISSDGTVLPPLIIFKGAAVQERWISKKAYPGTLHSATKNGWMEEPVFFNWFQKLFVPAVQKRREDLHLPNQTAVLLYDGHQSHYSLRIVECAIENNIQLVKFPSHLTDKLQPLDTCVFGPLKTLWEKKLVEHGKSRMGIGSAMLSRELFGEYLGTVWTQGMKPENIKKGFSSTGIFPLDSEKFDKTLFRSRDLDIYKYKKSQSKNQSVLGINVQPPTSTGEQNDAPPVLNVLCDTVEHEGSESDLVLDLSTKANEPSPMKPTSIIDLFAEKIRNVPKINNGNNGEVNKDELKKNIRLKQQKYGEVLSTAEVMQRLKEAEHAKNEKLSKKRKYQQPMKKTTNKKRQTEEEEEEEENIDADLVVELGSEHNSEISSDEDTDGEMDVDKFFEMNSNMPTEEDFVIVQFKRPNKNEFVYYVAKVVDLRANEGDSDVKVSFLRKKRNQFVFPDVEDVHLICLLDIKMVLPKPFIKRGYHNFSVKFPCQLTLN